MIRIRNMTIVLTGELSAMSRTKILSDDARVLYRSGCLKAIINFKHVLFGLVGRKKVARKKML